MALVVHDKINLQNSVDLAAYYGAQKQAEVLNVIAHVNYQIRQSWKLLAWRYRILGTIGLKDHPQRTKDADNLLFQKYGEKYGDKPVVCASGKPTWGNKNSPDEQPCSRPNLLIPKVRAVSVIAGFTGINAFIASVFKDRITTGLSSACAELGAYNYWFGASILKAFREDQKNRKQLIYGLANNLSQNDDFIDIDGHSVKAGVEAVIRKNLTYGHQEEGLNAVNIQFFNSLKGKKTKDWLPEVHVSPMIFYAASTTGGRASCSTTPYPIINRPPLSASRNFIRKYLDTNGNLFNFTGSEAMSGDFENRLYNYSLGVEKNPWMVAYVGVKATSTSRQLFFPFGKPLKMIATAFAKPFGGRIGPWYGRTWAPGAKTSSNNPIDRLVPQRVDFTNLGGIDSNTLSRLPNFSRYPGDLLGLRSSLGHVELKGFIEKVRIGYAYYRDINLHFKDRKTNDILAWDHANNRIPLIRQYELAAIAPDLFDITYYSIEPKFEDIYLLRLENLRKQGVLGKLDIPIRGDLGYRIGSSGGNLKDSITASINQNYYHQKVNYKLRDWKHLLTSWLPQPGVFNNSLESDTKIDAFGKCAVPTKKDWPQIASSCVAGGGRTGYSVKLVSGPSLRKPLRLGGGAGAARSFILNPPPKPSDW